MGARNFKFFPRRPNLLISTSSPLRYTTQHPEKTPRPKTQGSKHLAPKPETQYLLSAQGAQKALAAARTKVQVGQAVSGCGLLAVQSLSFTYLSLFGAMKASSIVLQRRAGLCSLLSKLTRRSRVLCSVALAPHRGALLIRLGFWGVSCHSPKP